ELTLEAAAHRTHTPSPGEIATPLPERVDAGPLPQVPVDPPTIPSRPDVAAPAPPRFGRYEVRRPVGAGGFGTVYLCHDTPLDRPVALKVLRGGPGLPHTDAERFLQEARRLAKLRHPGIVTVHDVGVHEGQVFVVSDFLDGPDLGKWLKSNRPAWQ